MEENTSPQQPNSLGKASLILGIVSISLVFGIGLCAFVGLQQGWLRIASTALYVCGTSSAFLGLLGLGLGIGGLLGKNRTKATAIAGLLLGLSGVCMFIGILNTIQGSVGG